MNSPLTWSRFWPAIGSSNTMPPIAKLADSRNRCSQPDAVRAAGDRLRILFHDDPRNEFTNTIVDMMGFLKQLPDAVVYDP